MLSSAARSTHETLDCARARSHERPANHTPERPPADHGHGAPSAACDRVPDTDPPGWAAWLATPEAAKATGVELEALRAQALAVVAAGLGLTDAFFPAALAALRTTVLDASVGECGACGHHVEDELAEETFAALIAEASDPGRATVATFVAALALNGADVAAGRVVAELPRPARVRVLVDAALASAFGDDEGPVYIDQSPAIREIVAVASTLRVWADRLEQSEANGPRLDASAVSAFEESFDHVLTCDGSYPDVVGTLRAACSVLCDDYTAHPEWSQYPGRDAVREAALVVHREGHGIEDVRAVGVEILDRLRKLAAKHAPTTNAASEK
ncbi:MAG: hypothetical protein R3B99_18465 [Polyangiales bacterium]